MEPIYKRVLLKISGEALAGDKSLEYLTRLLILLQNKLKNFVT